MAPRIHPHVTLRTLRKLRGWTAEQLATEIFDQGVKVDRDHLLAVELGHRTPGFDLRVAWAAALGISPADIHTDPELRELIALADTARSDREAA